MHNLVYFRVFQTVRINQWCYFYIQKLDMNRKQTELSQQGYTSSDFLERLLGKSSVKYQVKRSASTMDGSEQSNCLKHQSSITNLLSQRQQIYQISTERGFKSHYQTEKSNLSLHHFGQFFKSILRQYECEENVQKAWAKFELVSYDVKSLQKVISEIQTQHSIKSLKTDEKQQELQTEHINTQCSQENSLANSVLRSQTSNRTKSYSLNPKQSRTQNSVRSAGNSADKKPGKKTKQQIKQDTRLKYRGIHKKMSANQLKIKDIIARK